MRLIATVGTVIIPIFNTPNPHITKNWVKDWATVNNQTIPLWYSIRGRYYYFQINDTWYKCRIAQNKQYLEWYEFILKEDRK